MDDFSYIPVLALRGMKPIIGIGVAKYFETKTLYSLLANLVVVGVEGILEGLQHIELFKLGNHRNHGCRKPGVYIYIFIYLFIIYI